MSRRGYDHMGDDALLRACTTDPTAFGVFYNRFEPELLGFFWRATRSAELAADLTAEVFAAALGSAVGFREERGTARSWLFGIARHELADAWSRGRVEDRARRKLGVERLELTDADLQRIEELGASEHGRALRLLGRLPAEQREAVKGRVLEGRDYAELATSCCCSEQVVRQRVSRGLRTLRVHLAGAS